MDILVVGGGGRESALVSSLQKSRDVGIVYCAPGNGGIAHSVPIQAMELDKLVGFALEKGIGFVVVASDDPLVAGLVDRMEGKGIPCFGPDQKAALIEGSKAFSKDLMSRYHIPTARYRVFTEVEQALAFVSSCPLPTVVKADGLALGKGVVVAFSHNEAQKAVLDAMVNHRFGRSGATVVIEEFLEGPEVSVLSFTDGRTLVPMVSSMDHKRAYEGDTGPNTGGMGTIAPNPFYTPEIAKECMQSIFLPTLRAMEHEGRLFKGCLYFGLMLTQAGPKVIEYNCRFGDPEAQVVLPLLKSDLLTIMRHVHEGVLSSSDVVFSSDSACCVVLASGGYPLSYEKHKEITITDNNALLFHAGTSLVDGRLVTSGGRVMDVVATAPTLSEAIGKAYGNIASVHFENMQYRRDIGQKALTGR